MEHPWILHRASITQIIHGGHREKIMGGRKRKIIGKHIKIIMAILGNVISATVLVRVGVANASVYCVPCTVFTALVSVQGSGFRLVY